MLQDCWEHDRQELGEERCLLEAAEGAPEAAAMMASIKWGDFDCIPWCTANITAKHSCSTPFLGSSQVEEWGIDPSICHQLLSKSHSLTFCYN